MLKNILKFVVSALVLSFVFFLTSSSSSYANSFSCTNYTLPVNLSSGDPTVYHVFGQLCSQGPVDGKTLQFVIHGATYDHNYMNWPMQPQKYSYVRTATDAGYATFNIDRVGVGLSDHPLSTLVTIDSNAFVVHQLVQDLSSGAVGGKTFANIILVGHSLGSFISVDEEANFPDPHVKGLILSGYAHVLNPAFLPVLGADVHPAAQDPKFANFSFPGVYLTSVPGTRGQLFYDTSDADPKVIALDEILKQTATDGEFGSTSSSLDPTISMKIKVPVLLAEGQNDSLYCNPSAGLSCADNSAVLQREQPDFNQHACLEAFVLANSGHDINLHLNAKNWFNAAQSWATRRVGPSAATPATQPCK